MDMSGFVRSPVPNVSTAPIDTSIEVWKTPSGIHNVKPTKRQLLEEERDYESETISAEKAKGQLSLAPIQARAGLTKALAGLIRMTPRWIPSIRTFIPDSVTQAISEKGEEEARAVAEMGKEIGGGKGAEDLRNLAATGLQSLPALVAGPAGGIGAIAIAAGVQSGGAVTEDAFQAYTAKGDPKALEKARLAGAVAGLVTGGLTRYMPGGTERFSMMLMRGQLTREQGVGVVATILKNSAQEWPEEALDQVSQGIVAKMSYRPEMSWNDVIDGGVEAGNAGALLAGIMGGAAATVEGVGRAFSGGGGSGDGGGGSGSRLSRARKIAEPIGQPTATVRDTETGQPMTVTGGQPIEVEPIAIQSEPTATLPEAQPVQSAPAQVNRGDPRINSGKIEGGINEFLQEQGLEINTWNNDQRILIHDSLRALVGDFPATAGFIKFALKQEPFVTMLKAHGLLPPDWQPIEKSGQILESGLTGITDREEQQFRKIPPDVIKQFQSDAVNQAQREQERIARWVRENLKNGALVPKAQFDMASKFDPKIAETFKDIEYSADGKWIRARRVTVQAGDEEERRKRTQTANTGQSTIHPAQLVFEAENPTPLPKQESMADTGKYPVKRVDPKSLKHSREVRNFKANADPITGEVTPLTAPTYDYRDTGAIQVWVRLNGDREVISGRHRLNQALRTGAQVPIQEHFESEGFTADDAKILDAELNIRDGQGDTADYANYFRNTRHLYEEETARARGLLRGSKANTGWTIGRNASDDLYSYWRSGKINDARAAAIAASAPLNNNLQRFGIRAALEGADAAQIVARMESASAALRDIPKEKQPDFGDILGGENNEWKLLEAKAKREGDYVAEKRRAINDIIITRQAVLRRFDVATGTGSIKADAAKAQKELTAANADMDRWSRWNTDPELRAEVEANAGQTKEPTPAIKPSPPAELVTSDARKTPEQLAEEKRIEEQKKEIAEQQSKKLTGAVDTTMDMLDPSGGDVPLLTQPPKKPQGSLAKASRSVQFANAVVTPPGAPVQGALTAYHGTPHAVDKFSTTRVGTGEGAQVYGWGLYFAENPEVAKSYRESLSRNAYPTLAQLRDYFQPGREVSSYGGGKDRVVSFNQDGSQWSVTVEDVKTGERRTHTTPPDLKKMDAAGVRVGGEYTVELNVTPDELLDYDKPMQEQSPLVQNALKGWMDRIAETQRRDARWPVGAPGSQARLAQERGNGGMVYATISRWLSNDDKAASEYLASIGIKGIRYLDQGSRVSAGSSKQELLNRLETAKRLLKSWTEPETVGHSEETRAIQRENWSKEISHVETLLAAIEKQTSNYVIFNENDIQITRENGQPVSMREAMQGSLATTPPEALLEGSVSRATGPEEIRQLIQRTEAKLSPFTVRVIEAMLDTPVMQNLDWGRLTLEIKNRIAGDYAGAVVENIIELTRDADADVFPHEVFHLLLKLLSPEDQMAVDSLRREAVINTLAQTTWTPAERSVLEKLNRGETLESDDFDRDLSRELYRLINPSEFLSEMAGEKFKQEVFNSRNRSVIGRLAQNVKQWALAIVDAVRRVLGATPTLNQLYRELLAGKHLPSMEQSVESFAAKRRGSFSKNAEEARNAEQVAQTAEDRAVEASHQLVQGHDIASALTKHDAGTVSSAAKTMLGYPDYLGITAAGRRLNGGIAENYQQLKSRITDTYRRSWLARLSHQQWEIAFRKWKDVIDERDEEFKRLLKPGFLKTLAREAAAKVQMTNADAVLKTSQSMIHSAMTLSEQALKDDSKSDLEMAMIEGELKALDDVEKSSTAMQLLLNDMVAVIGSTADGLKALTDPDFGTRKLLIQIYKEIKKATDPDANLHKSSLLNWAAYILNKNKDVRERLLAAHLASTVSVRNLMDPFQAKFLADLEADPVKAMKVVIRGQIKLATDTEKAAFAWRTLHKEVMARLTHFANLDDASEVAKAIMADPDVVSLRAEIKDDAQVLGSIDPLKPFSKNTLLLPDGSTVEIDPQQMVGSKTQFGTMRLGFEAAISKLRAWLNNPANAGDVNYRMHERNLGNLEDYFAGLSMLQPNDSLRLFKRSFEIVRNAVNVAGGRVAAQVRIALAALDRDSHATAWWTQKYTNLLAESAQKAIRSHGIKYSSYGGTSVHDANRFWYERVGNQLAYSYNRQSGELRVGDMLGSGEQVTQADIDHLRLMSDAVSRGFEIVGDRQLTKDTLGGFTTFRKALKGNPLMTTRVFNDDLTNFAIDFLAAREAKDEAKMLSVLDAYFTRIGFAFTWDRNADFVKATPFDGPNGAFEVLADRMANDPTFVTNTTEYFAELAALSSMTPAEVKRIILGEWGRIVADWHREASPTESADLPRGEETKNPFTRSRNEAIAPYVFYENAFRNSHSVQRFGSGIQSRAMDDVVNGLDALIKDVERQQKDFADQVARVAGTPKQADKKVKTRQAVERANGQNFDNYENLERRLKLVKDARDLMADKANDTDVDVTAGRYIGNMTGMLIGTAATARNVTMGPRYLGQLARRLTASNLRSYPMAMWYGWLNMGARMIGSLAYGVPKAAVFDFPVGAGKAIAGLTDPQTRSMEAFIHTLFRGVIEELSTNVYRRVSEVKRMIDAGIHYVPDAVKEWDNKLMGTWLTHGLILERDLSTIDKLLQTPAAIIETLILQFQKTLMPLFGDTGLNMATSMLMRSSVGPFQQIDHTLRRIYMDWKKSGYRAFDFTNPRSDQNVLSYQEVFPRGIGEGRLSSTERDLQNMREQFEMAGLNFDEKAAEFLSELDSSNTKAQFLSDEERDRMVSAAIDYTNRASLTNNPLNLKKKNFINNLIKPFMFWKVRMLSNFLNELSTAAKTDKRVRAPGALFRQRAGQFAVAATMVLLPMLFFGALTNAGDEEANRRLKLALFNQITGFRQPWERETGGSEARGWLVHAFNGVPFIDMAMNTAFNDMPNRASFDPSLAAVEKTKDVFRYVGGVVQTGDITYRLPELIGGLFPDAKMVTARMSSQEGKRAVANVAALARRHGPVELLRPSATGSSGGVMANELTPYADRMVNAAAVGNLGGFRQIYEEAVQVARDIGRENPEGAVAQMFRSRNPYSRALKAEMTPAQRAAFLSNLSPTERTRVESVERNLEQAGQQIGARMSFVSGGEVRTAGSPSSSRVPSGSGFGSSSQRLPGMGVGAGDSTSTLTGGVQGGAFAASRGGTKRGRVSLRRGRRMRVARGRRRRTGFVGLRRAPRLV